MLYGSHFAKMDDVGRLRLPADIKNAIEQKWGRHLFITSLDGTEIKIYPLTVWQDIARRLEDGPSFEPAVIKFTDLTSYYGRVASLDGQGRTVIPPLLRETASLDGECILLGKINHLSLWNRQVFVEKRLQSPITPEELRTIASFGR
ncbi:MAG: hypothetical protein AB1714_03855 [Acidobacteriota bacterium]